MAQLVKESASNARDLDSIPGLGRPAGEGKGYPLQHSGLENSMDYTVHGVAKSQTQLSDFRFTSLPWSRAGRERRQGEEGEGSVTTPFPLESPSPTPRASQQSTGFFPLWPGSNMGQELERLIVFKRCSERWPPRAAGPVASGLSLVCLWPPGQSPFPHLAPVFPSEEYRVEPIQFFCSCFDHNSRSKKEKQRFTHTFN